MFQSYYSVVPKTRLPHAKPVCSVDPLCEADNERRRRFTNPSTFLQQPADAQNSSPLVILFEPAAHETGFVVNWGRVKYNGSWTVRRRGGVIGVGWLLALTLTISVYGVWVVWLAQGLGGYGGLV